METTFQLALSLGSKLLDKFPNYPEKKKAKHFELEKKYNVEIKRSKDERDHDYIMNLKDELTISLKEIQGFNK